jgi:hypothetical protein
MFYRFSHSLVLLLCDYRTTEDGIFNSTQQQKRYGGHANLGSGSETQQNFLFCAEMIILEKMCNISFGNVFDKLLQQFCGFENILWAFTFIVIRIESLWFFFWRNRPQ